MRQRVRGRPEDDGIIPLFDQNFSAFEAKCFWQADGLAAAMLEDLCGVHSYRVYLFGEISSEEKEVRFFGGNHSESDGHFAKRPSFGGDGR